MKNTNNNKTNFPVNATKGAQVLALVFVIGAAVFTNGDQTAIAANASVQPHSGILIPPPPPPPPPTHNLKARKGAFYGVYGDSFATFYRASQIRIFSALDNALSQKAEETLTEFAAVKNAEVNFQTSLGNRKGQLGINLIGAFAESQNHGIGWQVRAFGGQNDTKGMNAGIFYRRVQNDLLYGINAFADYEDGDNGSFLRYSIGGELQNRYGALVANYYTPITGDKHTGEQVAFSREGYDFNLRLNIPRLDFLNARVDYYHYHGKYNVKEDKGLRYGAEAHLFPGLRVALLYDDDGDELGGDISYTHTIGEVQQSQSANTNWTPDLFAAVSREHSQRIVSVNVSVVPPLPTVPSFVYSNRNIVRPANNAIIGTVNIPAGYFPPTVSYTVSILANTIFSVATTGGIVRANIAADSPLGITATISINAIPTYATAFIISLNVSRASSPPSFQVALNQAQAEFGTTATIGAITISPGFFDNTPAINIPSGLTESNGTLTWQPAAVGSLTLSISVSGVPASQNTILLITAASYQRQANVQFTTYVDALNNMIVVTTGQYVLVTLPPAITPRPHILTIMRDLGAFFAASGQPGDESRVISGNLPPPTPYRFLNTGLRAWTITIVQGSEQMQSTLYAQADIPFNIPGFLPPIPQLPQLAFADPVILARRAGIQTFSRHSRAGGNQLAAGRRMLMAQSAI